MAAALTRAHSQALHEGNDSYDRLYTGLERLRNELQQLAEANSTLLVDGKPYLIRVVVCSDLKATRELLGIERLELSGPEHVQARC